MKKTLFRWIGKEITRKEKLAKVEGISRERKIGLGSAITELKKVRDYMKTHGVETPLPPKPVEPEIKTTTAREQIFELINKERQRQDTKYGSLDSKKQSLAGYMLILKKELTEAEDGWMKNKQFGHSALEEILQVAAVAIACLEQHGTIGNPL